VGVRWGQRRVKEQRGVYLLLGFDDGRQARHRLASTCDLFGVAGFGPIDQFAQIRRGFRRS
jgi:hypothetical protein